MADGEEKFRLAVAESAVPPTGSGKNNSLVIGFTDFTRQQEVLLRKLGNRMPVTVVFDHGIADRQGLPLPTLAGGEKKAVNVSFPFQPPPAPAAQAEETRENRRLLDYLQQNLWSRPPGPVPPHPDGSVELLKVKGGSRHELVAVANAIKRLLTADPTLSPEEIGVITPYPVDQVYQNPLLALGFR